MLRILVLCLLLLAAPAGALPVTVYANGDAEFGFDPDDVAAAIAAGAAEPLPVSGLTGDEEFFSVTTPEGIGGIKGKNKENPSQGSSIWTLQVAEETPADLLVDFHLVILGHDPNDPMKKYKTENVGLEVDTLPPWQLVENTVAPDQTYVAFSLGDLEAGGSYEIPVEYRVGQKLKKKHGEFVFPRYSIAFLSVPEPSALALLLGAAALGLAARRAG